MGSKPPIIGTLSINSPSAVRNRVKRKHGLAHENRVLLLSLGAGLAGAVPAILLLWLGHHSDNLRWTLTILIALLCLIFSFAVRSSVMRPLQTLSNMQAALREGDFSMRARGSESGDALSDLMREINALSESLREQRLGALESGALFTTIMSEIDVAIFTFDPQHKLRLANRAAERLLAQHVERMLGKTAEEMDLAELLAGESAQTVEKRFPARSGRWGIRRSVFRQGGMPHHLLVISDLSQALREEERQAWQRLVRVLGHEMNNSLAPISSIAESLDTMLKRQPRAPDWEDDLRRGLQVIADRSQALTQFMRDYSRLARLPKPQLRDVDITTLIRSTAGLEQRIPVEVVPGPEISLQADPDQLQQLLINLIRNAVDASLETSGKVSVSWQKDGSTLDVVVQDEGHGISNPGNLFVPFFTTKTGGSGIGLALSRQIAEGHGGSLTLSNRPDHPGCEAHLHLPL